ncbi:glycoside hydrolase family 31 protein [Streptomyces sp. NPDC090106]|uniref:glycoside hydrolase family 31 protein n=1 Tax=Streptomyces sp. NPDC090106 TaxID=3365946 RepID=UPI0038097F39
MTGPALDVTLAAESVAGRHDIALLPGERWWGGAVADGGLMPFGRHAHNRDLAHSAGPSDDPFAGNQSAPLLLSSHGRLVWSPHPFAFAIDDTRLRLDGQDITVARAGTSLREAYLAASARWFPPTNRTPARRLFSGPQYNTWIDSPYTPTQHSVTEYAHRIQALGMPPGVIMIDDSWSPAYGTWTFDQARFPYPAAMVNRLHGAGFAVMLWVVPFVSPDTAVFRELESRRMLVRTRDGDTKLQRWWNGVSAVLDLTHPDTVAWLKERLDDLRRETGVDGFKLDGGDLWAYSDDDVTHAPTTPVEHCRRWAETGLDHPYNELRACWGLGGAPLAQRLRDKPPTWGEDGLRSLVPELVAQGLLGHPYVCPDMIGGGEINAVTAQGFDQELFVRHAQLAATAPMMQFSALPDRVLDEEHRAAVLEATETRGELWPLLDTLIDHAATTGEPILRPLAYHYGELTDVTDQFLLGPDLMVAPVLDAGATVRRVVVPAGDWADAEGHITRGPAVVDVPVTLRSIPLFFRAV